MSETMRQEPVVETPATSAEVPVTIIDLARPARTMPAPAPGDQLSRIEEKAARIEEKFARQEAVFGRAQDVLDRSAERVEMAARSVDAAELANEVARLRARVEQTPRFGALLLTTLLTAAITTAFVIAALKFFPGLLR
jgi:uncharacterized membrane protein